MLIQAIKNYVCFPWETNLQRDENRRIKLNAPNLKCLIDRIGRLPTVTFLYLGQLLSIGGLLVSGMEALGLKSVIPNPLGVKTCLLVAIPTTLMLTAIVMISRYERDRKRENNEFRKGLVEGLGQVRDVTIKSLAKRKVS